MTRTTHRLLPDPIPRGGGMLSAFELECVRSVLKRLANRTAQGLNVAAWPAPSQNAFRSLCDAGYIAEIPTDGRDQFTWTTYRITDAGRTYLGQIGTEPTTLGLVSREVLDP